MKFSVLISIYFKENPKYFNDAMDSIWERQTLKPDEVVLVEDGPLTEDLDEVICIWQNKLGSKLKVIKLQQNVGLGQALNEGLSFCSHDLVARMDTDDLSKHNRFEKQILYMSENPSCDVLGGWIEEFHRDINEKMLCRKTPLEHAAIVKFLKKRNAMNHVSIIFRKAKVQEINGYKTVYGFEDYDLWVRMILAGFQFANLAEVLVSVRIGNGLLGRRKGLNYALTELYFQKRLVQYGFLSPFEFFRNTLLKFPLRLAPSFLLRLAYRSLRE